jgi:hypothetical protein
MKKCKFKENLKAFRREYRIVRELHDFCRVFATDHPRLFKCKHGGLVFVCSNYPDNSPMLLESHGFVACPPIYSDKATTYFKVFSNRRELNSFLADLETLKNKEAVASSCNLTNGWKHKYYTYNTAITHNVKFSGMQRNSGEAMVL